MKDKEMNPIYEHNEKMIAKYGPNVLFFTHNKINMQTQKIKTIQFEPFEGVPVERSYCTHPATQIIKENDTISIFVEPTNLSSGDKLKFVTDLPDNEIKKGDSCTLLRFLEKNNNRKEEAYLVKLENGKEKAVPINSCVYDSDYKFIYFCIANIYNKEYYGNFKKQSHFADTDNPIICAFRYKGNPDKNTIVLAREQFEKKFPHIAKLEKEGKISTLVLNSPPRNSTHEGYLTDCYIKPLNKWEDLKEQKQPKPPLKNS